MILKKFHFNQFKIIENILCFYISKPNTFLKNVSYFYFISYFFNYGILKQKFLHRLQTELEGSESVKRFANEIRFSLILPVFYDVMLQLKFALYQLHVCILSYTLFGSHK